ncbi:MAG: VTT domain-containing protein [Chloroflexi bacterium]|nr:VTT domain-containing protein [Chloroflexota bacterium]
MTQSVQTEQPPDPGEEQQQQLQYIRLWRARIRLEHASLAAIAVFAGSVAIAFIVLGLGEDDITGGWGYPILWVISLLRASSVILPIPGGGLTIAAGATMNPLWGIPVPIAVGVTAGTAESLGEFTGYWAGVNGGKLMEGRRLYELIRRWIRKAPFPTMFVMAFTPSPLFDVAGIAAGAARVPIRIFYPAVLLGKIGRGIAMGAAGFYTSDFLIDLFDALELQFAGDLLGSWVGRALVGIVALIAIAVLVVALRAARRRNLI